MPVISIQRDPANISEAEHHKIDGQVNLLRWLCANVEHNMNDLHCAFHLNQKELCNTWDYSHEKCNELLDVEIGLMDHVVIVVRPAWVQVAWAVAIAVIAAVAVVALMPKVNNQLDSGDPTSNNQLNTASNSFRPRQAIPDIAGQVVSYPDFAQRSYYYYENNRRVFVEVFCVGIGQYEASTDDVKEGGTPFSDISGYSAQFFGPDDAIGQLLNVYTNPATQDVDLLSPDAQTRSVYVEFGTVNAITGTVNIGNGLMSQLDISVGSNVDINLSARDSEGLTFIVSGSYIVASFDSAGFVVTVNDFVESGQITSGNIANADYVFDSPWYFVGAAKEVWFSLKMPSGIRKGDGTNATVTALLIIEELDSDNEPTGVTYSRGASFFGNTQEAQYQTFKLTQSDGLPPLAKYRARASRVTSYLGDNSLDLLTLDAINAVQEYTPEFSGASRKKTIIADTFLFGSSFASIDNITNDDKVYLDLEVGDVISVNILSSGVSATTIITDISPFGAGGANWSATINPIPALWSSNSGVSIRIENLSKILKIGEGVTILKVERRSGQRVNRGGSEKINCLVTRKLRIFDNDTKTYGTDYVATRSFADYVFYLLHERMGVAIENINTDDLFGIKENLSDAQLGYFDWTFDDKSVGARDRIELTCNVARVRYWNEGLTWSFTREELKPVRQLMFNRRNLKSASAQYVQRFRQPSNFDGVTIKYVDPVKNAQVEIHKRIVGTSFVDGQGNEPYEIELSGCRNLLQAQNRLELEVRRLIYQNIRVTDTALNDALLCRLGYRVDWVDMYDSDMFSGEIIGIDGTSYKTSERFLPKDGVEYYVYVTDDEGNPSNSVIATARSDGNIFGFEATGLSGVFLSGGVIQLGSRYFIASNDDLDASAFTVIGRGRPNERGECEIELAEYNPIMFEAD